MLDPERMYERPPSVLPVFAAGLTARGLALASFVVRCVDQNGVPIAGLTINFRCAGLDDAGAALCPREGMTDTNGYVQFDLPALPQHSQWLIDCAKTIGSYTFLSANLGLNARYWDGGNYFLIWYRREDVPRDGGVLGGTVLYYQRNGSPRNYPDPDPAACTQARQVLVALNANLASASCRDIQNIVCGDPSLFTGTNPIRQKLCTAPDNTVPIVVIPSCPDVHADPCGYARCNLQKLDAAWSGASCADIFDHICKDPSLFVGDPVRSMIQCTTSPPVVTPICPSGSHAKEGQCLPDAAPPVTHPCPTGYELVGNVCAPVGEGGGDSSGLLIAVGAVAAVGLIGFLIARQR